MEAWVLILVLFAYTILFMALVLVVGYFLYKKIGAQAILPSNKDFVVRIENIPAVVNTQQDPKVAAEIAEYWKKRDEKTKQQEQEAMQLYVDLNNGVNQLYDEIAKGEEHK
jgi:hypothetical protein